VTASDGIFGTHRMVKRDAQENSQAVNRDHRFSGPRSPGEAVPRNPTPGIHSHGFQALHRRRSRGLAVGFDRQSMDSLPIPRPWGTGIVFSAVQAEAGSNGETIREILMLVSQ
jgi:hypothetical protein